MASSSSNHEITRSWVWLEFEFEFEFEFGATEGDGWMECFTLTLRVEVVQTGGTARRIGSNHNGKVSREARRVGSNHNGEVQEKLFRKHVYEIEYVCICVVRTAYLVVGVC